MHSLYLLFADRNEEINRWLDEHPLVLGLCAILLGAAIAGWGLYELKTGVSYDKKGRKMEGGDGQAMTILRLVVGGLIILFGLYKMVAG